MLGNSKFSAVGGSAYGGKEQNAKLQLKVQNNWCFL